jgi:hypothetical protein
MKHRAGCLYRFVAVLMDRNIMPDGTIVRVVPASGVGLPSRFAYVEHVDGRFIQMVCSNSLQPLTPMERKFVRTVLKQRAEYSYTDAIEIRSTRTETENEIKRIKLEVV